MRFAIPFRGYPQFDLEFVLPSGVETYVRSGNKVGCDRVDPICHHGVRMLVDAREPVSRYALVLHLLAESSNLEEGLV